MWKKWEKTDGRSCGKAAGIDLVSIHFNDAFKTLKPGFQ
jgi:hypothetical protein